MKSYTVWYFSDNKPGHENQTRGLLQALAQYRQITVQPLPLTTKYQLLFDPPSSPTPPDLIIGAGHATHFSVWMTRKRFTGRSIILMKPSLPLSFFDLCIVPEHDQVKSSAHVITTKGVLNLIQPSQQQQAQQGLLLIGGASNHFIWNSQKISQQIQTIIQQHPINWQLTTSRRTPDDFLSHLPKQPNLTITPHTQTDADWLPQQLQQAAYTWVSPDSVSMVYEALTAGSAVAIFNLEKARPSRVVLGLQQLLDESYLIDFDHWQQGQTLSTATPPLFEADRCAQWIAQKWLN